MHQQAEFEILPLFQLLKDQWVCLSIARRVVLCGGKNAKCQEEQGGQDDSFHQGFF
jgi:hypothetical protein